MAFPETDQYVVLDALDLVDIKRDQDPVTYAETQPVDAPPLTTASHARPDGPGANLGATQTDGLPGLWTGMNARRGYIRGHGPI